MVSPTDARNLGRRFIALDSVSLLTPFGILLFRDVKRRGGLLIVAAVIVLVMQLVNLVWLVFPAFSGTLRAYQLPRDARRPGGDRRGPVALVFS